MDNSVLVELLNKQLADTIDLRLQIRQAEFNITSPYGKELKDLFDGLAHDLQVIGDLIARSIRDLGGIAMGTVRLVARETELQAYPLDATDVRDHLNALLSSHSRYALDTRQNLKASLEIEGGAYLSQVFETVLTSIESNLWFLEAYLEGITVGNQRGTLPHWNSAFGNPPGNGQNNANKPMMGS
jgi:starvation-inducible DNA-binding protein